MSYAPDIKVWLNLTNGLEAAPELNKLHIPYHFCRFRSTSLEQKRWSEMLDAMPDDILMNIAKGTRQVIVDFGANKTCSRAMRQGIPIVTRMISLEWGFQTDSHLWMFGRNGKPMCCDEDFTRYVMRLNKKQKARLKYFKRFVAKDVDGVNLITMCAPTCNDGDYGYYVECSNE